MYPILEFDPDRISLIEPTDINQTLDFPEYCIICFFGEVIEIITSEFNAKILVENRWEDGPHRLFEIEYQGKRLAFFPPGMGSDGQFLENNDCSRRGGNPPPGSAICRGALAAGQVWSCLPGIPEAGSPVHSKIESLISQI